ncbi:hypothetical protein FOZ62_026026 [Perkinsus olseni]|uniref:Uncharacterized protein n=2 Tax=Perkinsus olseni TaxID=32597 RepID=A0A7J6QG07_PEROL|nr:hypothetical protein FOZ62_026026 [Perkinsus olseni]
MVVMLIRQGGMIRAVGSSMVSLRRLASSSGTEGPGFTAYVEAIKARKLTDEMAMELTAALRSEERRGADPTGACLTAAMYLGVVRSTSQIPRLFLATALPDIEAESMASITKVVTLEEVKSILQRLLKEDGNQLTMEAAVRAVVFLHHNRVEVTDSMLDVVLAAHQSALAAVVNGNITKKEYLEELAESMKVMKYFSKNKAAREGFLPYYQRAVSAITRSGYYGEGLVEVLLRVGRLLRLRTFTRIMRSYREKFSTVPPSELTVFPQLLERFDVRDSHYFESFLVHGVCGQLSAFTVDDVRTLLRSLLAYRCPFPTEPEPYLRFLKRVSNMSSQLEASTLATVLAGSSSALRNSEIARVEALDCMREIAGQLIVQLDSTESLPDPLVVVEGLVKCHALMADHEGARRLLTRALTEINGSLTAGSEETGRRHLREEEMANLLECIGLGYDVEPELTTSICRALAPAVAASPKGHRVRCMKTFAEVAPPELATVMVAELDESRVLEGLRESQLPSVASVWMGLLALTTGQDSRLSRLAEFVSDSENSTLGDLCRAWAALGGCDYTIVESATKGLTEAIKAKLTRELEPRHLRLIYGSLSHPKTLKDLSAAVVYEAASYNLSTKCALYAAITGLHDAVGAAEVVRLIVKQLKDLTSQTTTPRLLDDLYEATVHLSVGNMGGLTEDHKGLTARVLRQYARAITDFAPKRRKRSITPGGAMFAVAGASHKQTRRLAAAVTARRGRKDEHVRISA